MATWIKWPPNTTQDIFPKDFLLGDPLDMYWPDIQSESCPKCGFTVEWIMHKEEFPNWNEDTRRRVSEILSMQHTKGDCPSHPKPSWV